MRISLPAASRKRSTQPAERRRRTRGLDSQPVASRRLCQPRPHRRSQGERSPIALLRADIYRRRFRRGELHQSGASQHAGRGAAPGGAPRITGVPRVRLRAKHRMHRPDEPGYSRPGVYVLDNWRERTAPTPHRCRACFETRLSGAPQHEEIVDGINGIPHPEEAAERLSRRTHNADPADPQFLHPLEGGRPVRAKAGSGLRPLRRDDGCPARAAPLNGSRDGARRRRL